MASFMDILSSESKQQFSSIINIGDILAAELTPKEGVTPKEENQESRYKYFVVVGKTEDGSAIGFLLINSKINSKLSQELKGLHYPLQKSKYDFLAYDSHVYCGEIKKIDVVNLVSKKNFKSFGRIEEEDLELIKKAVISSPIVSKKELIRYGLVLQDAA
ncbi:hypothetical protein HMPREF3027_06730 [Porphyromonas sp. HMSC077F02]|uniref:hypothetical protein n=1 Tax=Porphyromonas sp. HMSC077F02 TaxID=1739529 RepID=UPI0008A36797|nr:hypothetical protein [Porphyromonas sp. HMSC077F02]OFO52344.1 hypothetical protein HMPREF3027_06730 [Porphyromonas sp. HMSC077F02]